MLKRSFVVVCICFLMVSYAHAELISVGAKAPAFSISDYNDTVITSQQCAGKKVILLFGGRKEGPAQTDLKIELDKAFMDAKDVVTISIGIIKPPAFVPQGLIKSSFKKETKGIQTFCDWGGKMAASYGVPDSPITAILINREGIVTAIKENFSKADLVNIIKKIDK